MSRHVKNLVFAVFVVLLVYVPLEGILYLAGVTPLSDRTDPYVGFAGYSPLFVEATSDAGERVFRTSDTKIDWFNRQQFPARKTPGVRRVFCLGGSTTYGRPYDDTTSFCGWLRAFLPAADPSREWEIINAGGISYASYRVVRLMEELVGHEPDLFIVYTGHNEFLERRTYGRLLRTPEFLRDVGSIASHLRLYSLLSDIIYPAQDVLDTEIDATLDRTIGPEDYHRDDEMRDAVLEHFRLGLEGMARIAEESGARLIFVRPASNIRDFSPFKAEPGGGLDSASMGQVERLKSTIGDHLDRQEYDQAEQLAARALSIDDRDAELLFRYGRAVLARGQTEKARRAFSAARDEDVAPLRALSPMAGYVTEVASNNASGLVDFVGLMADASADGIPGNDQFLDHVHPSIEAHRILALALLDEMVRMQIADLAPTWNATTVSEITERVEGGIDEGAHARALSNVARVLSWAGKQEEAVRLAVRATEITEEPHALYQMLVVLVRNDRFEEALEYAGEAARLMPDIAAVRKMNGIILSENGRSAEALPELQTAARLDPTMTDIHYHLGVVLSDLGQLDRAEQAYVNAIELEPGNADALNNLGILLARRGDYAGAIQRFERAVTVDPGHTDAARNLERARGLL